jgi:hypothetical protein
MTLVVGMYYNNKEGAVIASDSKVVWGNNYRTGQKVFNLENLIISSCGDLYLRDELIQNARLMLNVRKDISAKDIIQQIQIELHQKYKVGENPILEENEELSEGLCGSYTDHPEIFHFLERVIEPIDDFIAIGQGYESALNFFKEYYKQNSSKEWAIKLSVYSIVESARNNYGVDDNPQIALINNEGCKILNYDGEGNFNFIEPAILDIKNEINGMNKYQRKTFETLLGDNKEKKDKLVNFLKKL